MAELRAVRPLEAGAAIRPVRNNRIHMQRRQHAVFMVTFDGSFMADRACGGAAAVLWGPPGDAGRRQQLEMVDLELHGCGAAVEAEAAGCSLALQLVLRHVGANTCCIAGDCRDILRHAAGVGRLTRPAGALGMERALADAALAGARLSWSLIPRAANRTADAAARAAAARALGHCCAQQAT